MRTISPPVPSIQTAGRVVSLRTALAAGTVATLAALGAGYALGEARDTVSSVAPSRPDLAQNNATDLAELLLLKQPETSVKADDIRFRRIR